MHFINDVILGREGQGSIESYFFTCQSSLDDITHDLTRIDPKLSFPSLYKLTSFINAPIVGNVKSCVTTLRHDSPLVLYSESSLMLSLFKRSIF